MKKSCIFVSLFLITVSASAQTAMESSQHEQYHKESHNTGMDFMVSKILNDLEFKLTCDILKLSYLGIGYSTNPSCGPSFSTGLQHRFIIGNWLMLSVHGGPYVGLFDYPKKKLSCDYGLTCDFKAGVRVYKNIRITTCYGLATPIEHSWPGHITDWYKYDKWCLGITVGI